MNYSFLDGQHLIIFLKHFGWNTIDISKELGLSQPTISRIASGKQHPTRETYDKILSLVERECGRVKEMRIRLLSLTKDFA